MPNKLSEPRPLTTCRPRLIDSQLVHGGVWIADLDASFVKGMRHERNMVNHLSPQVQG